MFLCYILRGSQDFYYCGITGHIAKRIKRHNAGGSKSTRKHTPLFIVYTSIFSTMAEARIKEVMIKNQGVRNWYNKNIRFRREL
jgi:predicted GIY-YIG superfamily endonuclease